MKQFAVRSHIITCAIVAFVVVGIYYLWTDESATYNILGETTRGNTSIVLEERGWSNRKIIVTQGDETIIISNFDGGLDKQDMLLLFQQLSTIIEREQREPD